MWINQDQISFPFGSNIYSGMLKFVKQFQPYLNETQKGLFETFAVDVLISTI
jgi:hypothetical protein